MNKPKNEKPPVNDTFANAVEYFIGAIFGVLCMAVVIQVIARYFFNFSFRWAEEFPILLFTWVSFLAAPMAYRENRHLSIDLLFDKFPGFAQKIINYLNLAICIIFFSILLYYGVIVSYYATGSTFVVMKISKFYYYVSIPIACALFVFFIFIRIWNEKQK